MAQNSKRAPEFVTGFDPDPTTTVMLLLTAIGTAYQVLIYHQPQPKKWLG